MTFALDGAIRMQRMRNITYHYQQEDPEATSALTYVLGAVKRGPVDIHIELEDTMPWVAMEAGIWGRHHRALRETPIVQRYSSEPSHQIGKGHESAVEMANRGVLPCATQQDRLEEMALDNSEMLLMYFYSCKHWNLVRGSGGISQDRDAYGNVLVSYTVCGCTGWDRLFVDKRYASSSNCCLSCQQQYYADQVTASDQIFLFASGFYSLLDHTDPGFNRFRMQWPNVSVDAAPVFTASGQ
jgi:hypothetical protein